MLRGACLRGRCGRVCCCTFSDLPKVMYSCQGCTKPIQSDGRKRLIARVAPALLLTRFSLTFARSRRDGLEVAPRVLCVQEVLDGLQVQLPECRWRAVSRPLVLRSAHFDASIAGTTPSARPTTWRWPAARRCAARARSWLVRARLCAWPTFCIIIGERN
jgi:hypothetical protein